MREIKFRAWDKLGKILYKSIWNLQWCFGGIRFAWDDYENSDGETMITDLVDKEYELLQYTGLKDKNGVKIYEGDLLRVQSQYETDEPVDSSPNKVYFRDGAFRCGFHDMILGEKVCTGSEGNWNMEVIGNIYENPGLLTAKERKE